MRGGRLNGGNGVGCFRLKWATSLQLQRWVGVVMGAADVVEG